MALREQESRALPAYRLPHEVSPDLPASFPCDEFIRELTNFSPILWNKLSPQYVQMAVQRIAVETWQMILRYAIAVPVFFDTNPIQGHGIQEYSRNYDDDSLYWASERHRNILRRVCSSWNLYLQRYSNRYVILEDVRNGSVGILAITQAIRLEHHSGGRDIPVYQALIKQALLLETKTWSLEVLFMEAPEIRDQILCSSKITRLGALFYGRQVVLSSLNHLSIMHCKINGIADDSINDQRAELSRMTSLCLIVDSIGPFLACDFPSLRHFSILQVNKSGARLRVNEFLDVMRHVGKQLITFFDKSDPSRNFIPQETWSFCPKLEHFQTGFRWPVKPPVPGSLRTVRLAADVVETGGKNFINRTVIPLVPTIQCLSFAFSWKSALLEHECSILYVQYALDNGMTICDISGMSFQELVVRLLLHLKSHDASFMRSLRHRYWDF